MAQQPKKVSRIGYLSVEWPSASRIEPFERGLRELSYIDGKNILIEYRWAKGKAERLPDLAAELVRLNVQVTMHDSKLWRRSLFHMQSGVLLRHMGYGGCELGRSGLQ